ncbi:hypothetical protein E2R51_09510 [Jeotgalibacillus sp. S-D1]|nr:hypothetical protein E2R51_09510 [Jeotgalibacillus sp. S-D1]
MKFNFHMHEDLPKLSWCLKMEKDQPLIEVSHGKWVEANARFFIEGTWNGEFDQGDFDHAETVMGSGAAITGDTLVVCTPSHTTECLYSKKKRTLCGFPTLLHLFWKHLDLH